MRSMRAAEYYSALKRKEGLTPAPARMSLGDVTLSERSGSQKDTCRVIALTRGSPRGHAPVRSYPQVLGRHKFGGGGVLSAPGHRVRGSRSVRLRTADTSLTSCHCCYSTGETEVLLSSRFWGAGLFYEAQISA